MGERVCHKCKQEIPADKKSWYGLDGYECESCSDREAAEYPKARRLIDGPICLGVHSKMGIILSEERARSLYHDLGKALHEDQVALLAECRTVLESVLGSRSKLGLFTLGEACGMDDDSDSRTRWKESDIRREKACAIQDSLRNLLAKLPGRGEGT
jgi:hypothetical protein